MKALPEGVLPKSSTGKAVRHLLNNGKALNVFTTRRRLTIDCKLSERTVRALAIGRANWKFIGSEPAGYGMAILFTIRANAKRRGLTWSGISAIASAMRRDRCSLSPRSVPSFKNADLRPQPPNSGWQYWFQISRKCFLCKELTQVSGTDAPGSSDVQQADME